MTEFYLKISENKIITERGSHLSWTKGMLEPVLNNISMIGIKQEKELEIDEKKRTELEIPSDALALIQCKFAELISGVVMTKLHIIGYVDAAYNTVAAVVDFRTGEKLDIDISGLDLSPHMIWKD